ncbi:MAG TPA: fluoride efflux transporter CrcB [Longimicrobiaceae bacterium]|nr:fluoride efflux transporter CrcB [Longimicrobiaceae bacterium]
MIIVFLAIGGVLGTVARYFIGGWAHSEAGTLPWGTLAVNVLGSLILGFSIQFTEAVEISPEVRVMITVGFCGALTTFSTFSYETVALIRAGDAGRAVLYAFGSLSLGLAAILTGVTLAAYLTRHTG